MSPNTTAISQKELSAYIAGFLDGDSTIGVHRYTTQRDQKVAYTCFILVYNTNRDIIQFLYDSFASGTLYETTGSHQNYAIMNLRISGKRCGALLTELLPYLRVKREEALVVIEFSELIHEDKRELTTGDLELRESCYQKWREAAAKRRLSKFSTE